jgi:soluble lytic murein transglycosylase
MKANEKKYISIIRTTFWSLAILGLLTTVAVGFKYAYNREYETKIADLEKVINNMRSSINVDSIRQFNINKIISIIEQYNVEMPLHQKYEIAEEIYRMSEKYSNLNVDLICAAITHESGGTWDPNVISPAGAMGLMQLMPTTGMFVATYENIVWTSPEEILYNPIYNIRIGCRYLSTLIDLYDLDGGLAAYNGGEYRAALWLGKGKAYGILAPETQDYVPAIRKLYADYQNYKL